MKNFLFLLVIIIILAGCNNEQKNWEKACKKNTEASYFYFIKKYPGSKYLTESYHRLFDIRDIKKQLHYFYINKSDTVTGIYDVSTSLENISDSSQNYIRNDYILSKDCSWGIFVTKKTNFNNIENIDLGKSYKIKGLIVNPKMLSVDTIRLKAEYIRNEIASIIENMDTISQQYINSDSLESLYKMHHSIREGLFDSLRIVKEMDDEYEMIFHYYKMTYEMPDSFMNKPVRNIILDELTAVN